MKYIELLSFALFLCLSFTSIAQTDSTEILVEPEVFLSLIDTCENAFLIDVRKAKHYKKSRIYGASLAESKKDLLTLIGPLNKETPLLIYCYKGFRSLMAAKVAQKNGYTNVYALDGGMTEWKKLGFPIEK